VATLKKLGRSFYRRKNVVEIARDLIGKILVTGFDEILTSARIVETEAYAGVIDRASHAHGGRRTKRTEIMYAKGGHAYIYLCYGVHHLFNIVTNGEDVPHAVLVRAAEPLEGIEQMMERAGRKSSNKTDISLTSGPGNLSRALGISTHHSGIDLLGEEIFIASDGLRVADSDIISTPRIGVEYAGEDAMLRYRFILRGNPYISAKKIFKI
jgi:DNA-3-methyladenine glycosylase